MGGVYVCVWVLLCTFTAVLGIATKEGTAAGPVALSRGDVGASSVCKVRPRLNLLRVFVALGLT